MSKIGKSYKKRSLNEWLEEKINKCLNKELIKARVKKIKKDKRSKFARDSFCNYMDFEVYEKYANADQELIGETNFDEVDEIDEIEKTDEKKLTEKNISFLLKAYKIGA